MTGMSYLRHRTRDCRHFNFIAGLQALHDDNIADKIQADYTPITVTQDEV